MATGSDKKRTRRRPVPSGEPSPDTRPTTPYRHAGAAALARNEPAVTPADKALFGPDAQALTDKAFARSFAVLGAIPTGLHDPIAEDLTQAWEWSFATLLERLNDPLRGQPNAFARAGALQAQWQGGPRRVVMTHFPAWQANPFDISPLRAARILAHRSVNTSSVFLEIDEARHPISWEWPARLTWMPEGDDKLSDRFATLRPSKELLRPDVATRTNSRAEFLVSLAGVRETLRQVLSLGHRIRAAHLFLMTGVNEVVPGDPLLAALLRETDAFGVSLVMPRPTEDLTVKINDVIAALSHGDPLDVALHVSFPPSENSLHLLSPTLIRQSAITSVARRLTDRLRVHPSTVRLPIDLQDLNLGIEVVPQDHLPELPGPAVGPLIERLSFRAPRAGGFRGVSERRSGIVIRFGGDVELPGGAGGGLPLEAGFGSFPAPESAPSRQVGNLDFNSEYLGATTLKQLSIAEKQVRLEAPGTPSAARWLQGTLYSVSNGELNELPGPMVEQQDYRLWAAIGPDLDDQAHLAEEPFDETKLDWKDRDSYTLNVVFAALHQTGQPQVKQIELPRIGRSTECEFSFSPSRAGPFHARLSVLHRNRLLQTSVLEATVISAKDARDQSANRSEKAAWRLSREMDVSVSTSALEDRRPFDACIIFNHTISGEPSMTVAADEEAIITSTDKFEDQLAKISSMMVELANKSKLHTRKLISPENGQWLSRLAAEGFLLYQRIVVDYLYSQLGDTLRKAQYIQVVTIMRDAVIPVEFVYEYAVPAVDAMICPNAERALMNGACPADCIPSEPDAPYVCPLGFWGLRRVIERHASNGRPPASVVVTGSDRMSGRKTLNLHGAALLAMSEQVTSRARARLEKSVRADWKDLHVVRQWSEWIGLVRDQKPVLFVVLGHAQGKDAESSLEIGGTNQRLVRLYDKSFVLPDPSTGQPPVVFLLGCDPNGVADPNMYASYVQAFRSAGSAVILATIAQLVLGDDAAVVAAKLVKAFVKTLSAKAIAAPGARGAAHSTADRFGEILLSAKRDAVRSGQLLGMSLVAFGDADWILNPGE